MVVNVRRVAVSPLAEPKTLRKSSSPFASLSGPVPTSPPTFFFFFFEVWREWLHSCPLPLPDSSCQEKPVQTHPRP